MRELAGISFANPFNGDPYYMPRHEATDKELQYLILADIILEGPYPPNFLRDHLNITIDPSGMSLLIPLPLPDDIPQNDAKGLTFWRAGFPITVKNELPPEKPDLAYLQAHFDKRRDMWEEKDWPKVLEVRESSRYRVREAMASTMYRPFGTHGHVLLVGDAAHVHSPAGGQGALPELLLSKDREIDQLALRYEPRHLRRRGSGPQAIRACQRRCSRCSPT